MSLFEPNTRAYAQDPYPALARLRAEDPVHRWAGFDSYVLTRYADCVQVLRDDRAFSSDPGLDRSALGGSVRLARAHAGFGNVPILANSDGATHSHLRSLVTDYFRARHAQDWKAQVEDVGDALTRELHTDTPFDAIAALAEPLPIIVVLNLLGIPPPAWDAFRRCAVMVMRGRMDGDRDAECALQSQMAAEALRHWFDETAEEHGGGLMAVLREANRTHEASPDEIIMMLVHIATAGNAATAFAVGNTLLRLAQRPDLWERLRRDASLVPGAVEESLRFDSPTHLTSRFAVHESVVGRRRISSGEALHLVVGAANRDPEAFPDPDTFDIERRPNRHLAFGLHVHSCLGAPLARLELQTMLLQLLIQFRTLELVSGGYEPGGTFLLRGPKRLVLAGRK
jgi:cytochrome P450